MSPHVGCLEATETTINLECGENLHCPRPEDCISILSFPGVETHTRLFQIERLVALLSAFAHPFKLAPGCAGTRKAGGQQIWLMMIAAFCDEQAGRFRGNVIGCGDRRCDSSR
jgi:hypothetical protein